MPRKRNFWIKGRLKPVRAYNRSAAVKKAFKSLPLDPLNAEFLSQLEVSTEKPKPEEGGVDAGE